MGLTWDDRQGIIEDIQHEILNLEEYEEYRENDKQKEFMDEVSNPVISMTKDLFFYNLLKFVKKSLKKCPKKLYMLDMIKLKSGPPFF